MIIRNAWKSIVRAKGRNILIGIIVFAIAVASCIALSIKNAAKDAEGNALESVVVTASISQDREKLMEGMSTSDGTMDQEKMKEMREKMAQYGDLELSELQTYAESELVKEFYYSQSLSLNTSGELEAYGSESTDDTETTSDSPDVNQRSGPGGSSGMMINGMSMGDFTVTGYSSESAMTRFLSGASKISEGSLFDFSSSDKDCLISNELAVFNALSVGDSITLTNPNKEEESYTFKIVGIYTNTSTDESKTTPRFGTAMDSANLICISYEAMQTIIDNSAEVATTETDSMGRESSTALTASLSSTYTFANRVDYDAFSEEVTQKGLSEYYKVSSPDVENYESSLKPLESLSNIATTLLLVVFLVGAVILIVLNVFNIRERKYEVGVLTAIGIKKRKVAAQFVTELLAVTLVAIFIGAAVGAVASVPVANKLLESQITAQEEQASQQQENLGKGPTISSGGGSAGSAFAISGGNNQPVDYLDEINATANLMVVLQMIGIGLCLTLLSSLAAVVFVLRYEPLKILANRA